jgi:hypothetical protein
MGLGFADKLADTDITLFVGPDELLPMQRLYLNAYMAKGTHRQAAKVSGINRFYHFVWMRDDAVYQAAFGQIATGLSADGVELIEQRALHGYKEPLSFKGRLTGDYITHYSDTLQVQYLKAHDPKYRESNVTLNVGPQSLAITYPGANDLQNKGNSQPEPKQISQDK